MCFAGWRSGPTSDAALRSLLYAAIFYPATFLWVLAGIVASLFGRRPTLAVVLQLGRSPSLACATTCSEFARGRRGHPAGPLSDRRQAPVDVRDAGDGPAGEPAGHRDEEGARRHSPLRLADAPIWRHSGRTEAGAKALRAMVAAGKEAVAAGRPVIIFPEGTRVRAGETPPLQVGLRRRSIARSACRSCRSQWTADGCGAGASSTAAGNGDVQGRRVNPAGLKRDEIEARVHAAINALELAPEARA